MIDAKTKSYLAYVREIIDTVHKEFALVDKDVRILILERVITPIGFWVPNQDEKAGTGTATPVPKWWEKYPQLKPLGTDATVVKIDGFVDHAVFDEFNAAAKQNGYRYSKDDHAFIRSF